MGLPVLVEGDDGLEEEFEVERILRHRRRKGRGK